MALISSNPHLFSIGPEAGGPGLKGTRCRACGRYTLMAVFVCPLCLSRNVEAVPIGRRAILRRWSVVHHGADGFPAPYIIGEVETEEGPIAFAPIVADPQRLTNGAPLQFRLRTPGADDRVGFAYGLAKETP
jgi:uncharacterized OB-fold protein